jgi:hypothetical protein
MFGSNSRQQVVPLELCKGVTEPADYSSPMDQDGLYLTLEWETDKDLSIELALGEHWTIAASDRN